MKVLSSRDVLFGVAGVALAVQAFVVNRRVVELRERVEELATSSTGRPVPRSIRVGDVLPPAPGQRVHDGAKATLTFDAPRTLVYFVSPKCGACTTAAPEIRRLQQSVGTRVRNVAIGWGSPEPLARYLRDIGFQVEAYSISPKWLSEVGFTRTPSIALVAPGGRLEGVWQGAPSPEVTDGIVARAIAPPGTVRSEPAAVQ